MAAQLQVSEAAVGKWRQRCISRGLAGLLDEPRCGAPRRITDEQVEQVVVQTLETKPPNAPHWTTRSMAEASGLSGTSVLRIWHAFGLQPHRSETLKLSNDPQLVEKVRDIVGLYLHPPEAALVLCVDEKSNPSRPGVARRPSFSTAARLNHSGRQRFREADQGGPGADGGVRQCRRLAGQRTLRDPGGTELPDSSSSQISRARGLGVV